MRVTNNEQIGCESIKTERHLLKSFWVVKTTTKSIKIKNQENSEGLTENKSESRMSFTKKSIFKIGVSITERRKETHLSIQSVKNSCEHSGSYDVIGCLCLRYLEVVLIHDSGSLHRIKSSSSMFLTLTSFCFRAVLQVLEFSNARDVDINRFNLFWSREVYRLFILSVPRIHAVKRVTNRSLSTNSSLSLHLTISIVNAHKFSPLSPRFSNRNLHYTRSLRTT